MSRHIPDDEFDRRLRDVLRSRALSISPDADAIDRIHAGARRRQRRQRVAVSGGAALAVIAVAAVGITLRPTHDNGSRLAGGPSSNTPSMTTQTASKPPSPVPSTVAPSSNTFTATGPATTAPGAIPAGGAPPAGFVPMSVTAVNANTYWVLGHAPCDVGTCTAVAKTTDGGKTFTEVGAPASPVGPDGLGAKDVLGSGVVSEIRFGDGKNGWAFDGGLWQTADGGLSWSQLAGVDPSAPQFAVQRLAAANNRAWAIALTNANTAVGPTYAVYSTTYPGGTWQKVDSAGTFGAAEPMLGVEGTTVVVIGTDATTGKQRAVIATGGSTSFAPLPGSNLPCAYAPGDPVSTTTNALWLACASSGNGLSGAYVSPDFGTTWQTASSKLSSASVAIGAVDDKSAIVATGGKLLRVNIDGSTATVSTPNLPSATQFAFIGFTTAQDGFAIPVVNGTRQLWRTTDGGAHWSVVKF
ncbi:MAG TPA: hypothetical protein VF218_03680 [Acidothermaceae bacterium]